MPRVQTNAPAVLGGFCFRLLCLMLAPLPLKVQIAGEGAIQVQITDPSGAAIPNATVTTI